MSTQSTEKDELCDLFGLDLNELLDTYSGLTESAIEERLNADFPDYVEIEAGVDYRGRPYQNNAEMAERVFIALKANEKE